MEWSCSHSEELIRWPQGRLRWSWTTTTSLHPTMVILSLSWVSGHPHKMELSRPYRDLYIILLHVKFYNEWKEFLFLEKKERDVLATCNYFVCTIWVENSTPRFIQFPTVCQIWEYILKFGISLLCWYLTPRPHKCLHKLHISIQDKKCRSFSFSWDIRDCIIIGVCTKLLY